MKFKKINNGYILKLEKGEEIVESLLKFCQDKNIKSGTISGIGSTNNISLKYYDQKKHAYLSKKFSGKNYEILSLNGNISLVNDKPFTHIHIVLGDSEYHAFGGHLGSAVISVTCEIIIDMANNIIKRKLDDEFKLKLLNL